MNQSLAQLGRQLLAIWRQLGLNQRISIAFTGLVVVGALVGLGLWSSRSDYTLLYGRLDETEAGRVVAALDEAKIPYQSRGGGAVLVPADRVHQVRMQLASKGIPRGEGVGFEIFDKANFGVSDFVQRKNFTRAVQGELSRTISQLDQVESARVMIVMPENRLLLGTEQKPTASVFVRVKGNAALSAQAINSIRLLVANAVEGLQTSRVSVVDNLGNVLSDNEDDSVTGVGSTQLAARQNLEQYLARKAEGMLEKVLGQGQVVVRVSADINWDTLTRYEEKYDPDGQVVRISTVDDENTESAIPTGGGAAGLSSNSLTETNATGATSQLNSSRTKKKTTNNQYDINRTVSSLMQSAGGVERLSAAVFVAQQFQGTGADRQAVPRSPEELQKLKRIVQGALGIVESDPERADQITLEEMPFNEQPAIELARQLDRQEQRDYWMSLGERLILPAVGLVVFLLFWRAFKRTRAEDLVLGLPLAEASRGLGEGNGLARGGVGADGRRPGDRAGTGVVTVEVLNQLIRENPASMTQAVRSWMNRDTAPK